MPIKSWSRNFSTSMTLAPHLDTLQLTQDARLKGFETIPQIVDYATAKFNEKLDVFEGILEKQKYMGGDEFSLVDIFYLPYTQKLFEVGDGALITSRPNINAWWDRVSTRDSWNKVYKSL